MFRERFRFSMKSANLKYATQTLTRTLFSICAHECYVQNSAVARIFSKKRYSGSMFLHRLHKNTIETIERAEVNEKFLMFSNKVNMMIAPTESENQMPDNPKTL